METSVIIRTKNEERWIGAVLKMLQNQTYQDFEVIIVDSGSTDKTLEIINEFQVRLIQISQEEFSYPHALNVGCRAATAEKYLVFLSAHSLPVSKTWLEWGIENFTDEKVMGVYGSMRALPDGSIWEKLVWNVMGGINDFFSKKQKIIYKPGTGVMGFTHAIVRKELWEKENFDEAYGLGGEDMAWSTLWFSRGYVAIKDVRFRVKHSHGLGIIALIEQLEMWKSLSAPQPFRKLKYRKWNW